jgi:DNA invertase Pin-like site-specific DNA recombinase
MPKKKTKFTDNLPGESWKKLTQVEGEDIVQIYEVSSCGRVRRKEKDGVIRLMEQGSIAGYPYAVIKYPDGRQRNRYIHRLVSQLFLKPKDEYHQFVVHLDYDRTNNHIDNLQLVNRRKLFEHRKESPKPRKKRTRGYKLDENKVRRIKKLLEDENLKLSMIAKMFGITHTQLNRIRNGENWGHVTLE